MTRSTRVGRYVIIGLLATLLANLLTRDDEPLGQPLAYTHCTLSGPVLSLDGGALPAEDTLPVRVHEEVHVQQCNDLGWTKMRWKNLTAGGRLELEAPGYCAGARARLRRGDNYAVTRERLFDDANAMFAGALDSARVNAALRAACPELTASVLQKGSA
jgi:hypothetical protein